MSERSRVKRFFSRVIDYVVFGLVCHGVAGTLFPFLDLWMCLAGAACVPFAYVPFEALQLYLWQTTLGKGVLGLSVREEGKGKLSFKGAFRAAFGAFWPSKRCVVVKSERRRGQVLSVLVSLMLMGGMTFNNFFMPSTLQISDVPLPGGWMRYVSNEGKFSVDMPTQPNFNLRAFPVPQAGITLTLNEYTAKPEENSPEQYMVSFVNLPRGWLVAGSKKILLAALYLKYETQLGSDVLSKRLTTHCGSLPAIDFTAKQNDQRIQGRLVLIGNRLFQVSKSVPKSAKPVVKTTSETGEKSPDENFVESFNPTLR